METKEKILQSALKLFSEKGINGTSTSEISKDAGIATGTIFVHFKTKQELVDELYIQVKRNSFTRLSRFISDHLSVEENIKKLSFELITYFINNYNEFKFIEIVESYPQISEIARKIGRSQYRSLSEYFQTWIDSGDIKKIELELCQNVLWNLSGVIIQFYNRNRIKKVRQEDLEMIWDSVKKND